MGGLFKPVCVWFCILFLCVSCTEPPLGDRVKRHESTLDLPSSLSSFVRSRSASNWSPPQLMGTETLPQNSVGYLHGPELYADYLMQLVAWRLHEGAETTPTPNSVGKISVLQSNSTNGFLSNSPIPPSQAVNATLPRFAYSNGIFAASWSFQGTVYGSTFEGAWSPAVALGPGSDPYPILFGATEPLIFYTEVSGGGFYLHASSLTSASPITLFRANSTLVSLAQPSANGNGDYLLAWIETDNSGVERVFSSLYQPLSMTWTPAVEIVRGTIDATAQLIHLATNFTATGGSEVIVQAISDTQGDGLYRSTLSGNAWSDFAPLFGTPPTPFNLLRIPFEIANDGMGSAAMVWIEDNIAGSRVFSVVNVSRKIDGIWQAPFSISPPAQSDTGPIGIVGSFMATAAVAVNGAEISAIWVENGSVASTLYGAHAELDNIWSVPEKIVDYIDSGFIESSTISINVNGTIDVYWKQSQVSPQGLQFDLWHSSGSFAGTVTPPAFDPNQPLPTNHLSTSNNCSACHLENGTVFGIDHGEVFGPCVACHNGTLASGKSMTHVPATDMCDACHTTTAFVPAIVVDHTQVLGACIECHNNVLAMGKPPTHFPATDVCEACHSTVVWVPVIRVDHNQVIGDCFSCHNGLFATTKPPTHISTTDFCGACHSTTAWVPVITVDHNEVIGFCNDCHTSPASHVAAGITQQCDSCHSVRSWFNPSNPLPVTPGPPQQPPPGPGTPLKPVTHIPTSNNCAACHSSQSWIPVTRVDHDEVFGLCINCHNGVVATGKGPSHIPSSNSCNVCHTVSLWIPAIGSTAPLGFRRLVP